MIYFVKFEKKLIINGKYNENEQKINIYLFHKMQLIRLGKVILLTGFG